MKSDLIVAQATRLTIRKPPMFAVVCLAIWAVSLWLALHNQLPGGGIDTAAFMVSP